MSPVLASIDLYDRNFTAGREVKSQLALINETPNDIRTTVDVYITPRDPLFVPDQAALDAAVWRESREVAFAADRITTMALEWTAPSVEGNYFLAAVTRIPGGAPVVSQRVVRSIRPAAENALANSRFVLLGAPENVVGYLRRRGVAYTTSIRDGGISGDTVIIGPTNAIAAEDRSRTSAIREFVRNGGKLVILSQDEWNWNDLVDFQVDKARASRAFIYPGTDHPLLAGIDPEFLKRWNGLPGEIADRVIKGGVLNRARRLLWIENPDQPVAVSVAEGKGEIVICLLNFRDRLSPGESAYDPAAERVMLNLLRR